jgi:two-component system, sensor histidine kinase and response regulator
MLETAEWQKSPYQLLLIDSRMPAMDGFDLAAAIARPSQAAVVMMLTADDYNQGVRRCRELGIDSYLIKPVTRSDLLSALSKALAPEAERARALLRRAPASNGRYRILLAEDNLVNQKLAVGLLEKMGHQVVVAQSGTELLALLQQERFDLVLMDVQMPEMDGLAATREIRRREQGRQHIPVIAMTAHAMKGDRESCIAAGMDGYIAKPISRAELQEVIDQAMRVSEAISGSG